MKKEVAIGIITCHRPEGLKTLLKSLAAQKLSDENKQLFDWFTVVVDNDLTGKNKKIVDSFRKTSSLKITFAEQPIKGIPAARNKSIETAGDCDGFIFVDDDEKAPTGWLDAMLTMWHETGEDVITGPVHPILPEDTPYWIKKSGAFLKDYPYRRGQGLTRAYTNNTLVSKKVLNTLGASFNMRFQFTGSSDLHYFLRAREKDFKILWCPEAVINENIPHSRIKFGWILKRGFRSGAGESKAYMLIWPNIRTILGILYRGFGRMFIGVLQIVFIPYTRWRGLIFGCRRIASGIGCIAGLFGINYQEYKNIHGE